MSVALLTIDLDAVVANWRAFASRLKAGTECAAVVKADAYGLGVDKVAPALRRAGCRTFFVATLEEGLELRALLHEVEILVLNGISGSLAPEFAAARLTPVLNNLSCLEAWSALGLQRGEALPAALHLDTGMSRLGLPATEARHLAGNPERLAGIDVRLVMSHLSSADEPGSPENTRQLALLHELRGLLPMGKASLANSAGILLGPDYHFDLVRPGIGLYGGNPRPDGPNPMTQVVHLQGKILQVREIDSGVPVGYGATWRASRPSRIATVAAGYADGYLRSLSNAGYAFLGDRRVPVVGRVSMDLITLDVTDVAEGQARPGALVDLIGPHVSVDDVAAAAGTIGYEILTALGSRYRRVYRGEGA